MDNIHFLILSADIANGGFSNTYRNVTLLISVTATMCYEKKDYTTPIKLSVKELDLLVDSSSTSAGNT